MAARQAPRPGRPLAVLVVLLIAMATAIAITGATKPRYGLDLQGGTSVTLTPRLSDGAQVSTEDMATTANILRERVNALGVAESEVAVEGENIVVSVPGASSAEVLKLIGTTGDLQFRQVLVEADAVQPTATPSPAPSGSPSPSTSPSGSASPQPSASASPNASASPSPQGAADPSVIDVEPMVATVSPAPSTSASPAPSTSASASPKPSVSPTPRGAATTATVPTIPPVAPNASGAIVAPPALLAELAALDCGTPDALSPRTLPPASLAVACTQDQTRKLGLGVSEYDGKGITDAKAVVENGRWVVNITFDNETARKQEAFSTRIINQPPPQNRFAITLDGVVYSDPYFVDILRGVSSQISGTFTAEEAQSLANVLKFGALPVALEAQEVRSVSATLGSEQLRAGVFAGLLGLAVVAVYVLVYYRLLGLVAAASLVVAGLLTYGLIVLLGHWIGFTLTLAGVAGIIVSIGITADSFVVYFERVRDEVREGRTLRLAVEKGWERARKTIIAADVVSLLAAFILYWLAVGGVRGFAFALGLTTFVDLLVVFLFTKPLMTLLARRQIFASFGKSSGLWKDRQAALHRRPPTPTTTRSPRRERAAAARAAARAAAATPAAATSAGDSTPLSTDDTARTDGEES